MVVKNAYMNSRVSHKKSHQVQLNVSKIRRASEQTFLYWAALGLSFRQISINVNEHKSLGSPGKRYCTKESKTIKTKRAPNNLETPGYL